VGIFTLRNGAEFFNDVRRSWAIRVAHAEIDYIFATATRRHFQLSGDIKYIRREAIDTRKTTFWTGVSHKFLRLTLAPGPSERRCHAMWLV